MRQERPHYFARIPTVALLILLCVSRPLAVILFILRAIDRDMEKKEKQQAKAQADYTADFRAEDTRQQAPHYNAATEYSSPFGHDYPTQEQKKAKSRQQTYITLCGILGAVFLMVGLVGARDLIFAVSLGDGLVWSDLFTCLGQTIGGGGALALSVQMKRTRKLERELDKIVGERDNLPLDELFAAAGLDRTHGERVLESAIDHGYFGADAYIDRRTDFLVVRGPAPIPAEPVAEPEADTTGENEYQRLLRELREVNDRIPDPVMTAKISRLENVSAKIFKLAESDPKLRPQLQKFIAYYLPTALKLLNTYAQMDRQEVEGENIADAKRQIEQSMDMLITAFENQLDKLFQADALDVSADIAALHGMLNMDGLSGSGDFSAGLK